MKNKVFSLKNVSLFCVVLFLAFNVLRGWGVTECSVKDLKVSSVIHYNLPEDRKGQGVGMMENLQNFLETKGLKEDRNSDAVPVVYSLRQNKIGAHFLLDVDLVGHRHTFKFHFVDYDIEGYGKVEQFICNCIPIK